MSTSQSDAMPRSWRRAGGTRAQLIDPQSNTPVRPQSKFALPILDVGADLQSEQEQPRCQYDCSHQCDARGHAPRRRAEVGPEDDDEEHVDDDKGCAQETKTQRCGLPLTKGVRNTHLPRFGSDPARLLSRRGSATSAHRRSIRDTVAIRLRAHVGVRRRVPPSPGDPVRGPIAPRTSGRPCPGNRRTEDGAAADAPPSRRQRSSDGRRRQSPYRVRRRTTPILRTEPRLRSLDLHRPARTPLRLLPRRRPRDLGRGRLNRLATRPRPPHRQRPSGLPNRDRGADAGGDRGIGAPSCRGSARETWPVTSSHGSAGLFTTRFADSSPRTPAGSPGDPSGSAVAR